ncbi:MAG: SDR family oxidoreductase, partial [Deltaproteobacteria bacterium]|nr:SDR family oxidoreductase [Deltaproteobacteria bacterium]
MKAMKKMLIAGASGLVGFAAVRHFAELDNWEVVAISRRIPAAAGRVTLISVDLHDQQRCREIFGQMTDVTHLIYAALYEKPSLIQGWSERDQMETNLTMLKNLFEPLNAAANLQHVSLLQGTKAYGVHLGPMRIPARERDPRHQHANFYWLQEDYLRAKQAGNKWSWTILRPQLVIGEAIGGNLNIIPAIGVFAALSKEAGLPLSFPGGPPFIFEAVDADLLARSFEWAATTPACANEIFNITNGDVFVWDEVWPAIADALGMKPGPLVPVCLQHEMPKRAAEWATVVRKYGLRSPTDLNAFVGESFEFTDF